MFCSPIREKIMRRIAIAQDTLKIIEAGYYVSPEGKRIELVQKIVSCHEQTKSYEPDALYKIKQDILSGTPQFSKIEFEVKNETTLMGAERMARGQQFQKIGVLNFASASNGCDTLVLGAWGCGVFRNKPSMVAQMFADLLLPNGQFWGRIKSILFSILDSSEQAKVFAEFHSRFISGN
jgi:hypothetical protein